METGPVQQLVSPWWHAANRPRLLHLPALREALAVAALQELRQRAALGRSYDPFSDARLMWASQYLNHLENPRFRIERDVTARAAFALDAPTTPCGKDLAAGPA